MTAGQRRPQMTSNTQEIELFMIIRPDHEKK